MSQSAISSNDDSTSDLLPAVNESRTVSPSCDKCGANIDAHEALVCRKCGWYASIGSFVEIDQVWEADTYEPEEQKAVALHMPTWGWIMIACVVAVIAESIAARILTVEGSAARTMWSVTQLFVGASLLAVCHFIAFILLMREVSDAGLLDIIMKPMKPWILRVHELPAYQWICHLAISSAVAVVLPIIVIGGLPYEKLWDWGTKKPVKQNLMGAIMDQAKKVQGEEKSLEEAVQDLAGRANVNEGDDKTKSKPKISTEPKERQEDDCLIIGYRTNSEGLVYQLFLAGERFGKLQYVGQVTPQLSVKELREISEQLATHQAFEPFFKIQMDGVNWVKPKFACRVSYSHKGQKGGLYDVKLETFLGEISTSSGAASEKKKAAAN